MKYSVIVTGWNCATFVDRCLNSIIDLKIPDGEDFEIIIVDDGSTDDTHEEIGNFLLDNPVDVIHHRLPSNVGTFYARDHAIRNAKGEIIVMVDMDDYLLPDALIEVDKHYKAGKLMTYGNYKFTTGKTCPVPMEYPDAVHASRYYRKDTWRCTHLRTFKRELYHAIPPWELTKAEVNSYPDVEILFSMMEMAGKDRIGVVNVPIYVYNTSNPESTLKRFGKDYAGYYEICNRPIRNLLP